MDASWPHGHVICTRGWPLVLSHCLTGPPRLRPRPRRPSQSAPASGVGLVYLILRARPSTLCVSHHSLRPLFYLSLRRRRCVIFCSVQLCITDFMLSSSSTPSPHRIVLLRLHRRATLRRRLHRRKVVAVLALYLHRLLRPQSFLK